MADPLDYEEPKPRTKRPFWPEGYRPVEFVFLLFVFFASSLADDYLKTLGWALWLRMLVSLIVIYIGFWLSGRWGRRDPYQL